MVDNFIKNNLKKLIVELEKFSEINNEIKENKDDKDNDNNKIVRYFNFFSTNLKIIFYTFKTIMENNDMINYIEKFDDLDEDNSKNVFMDIKIEFSKEKQEIIQSLELERLINIIAKIIALINQKVTPIYRQSNSNL